VFEEINWHCCRHNTVPLTPVRSIVSDGVSPSPKGAGAGTKKQEKHLWGHSVGLCVVVVPLSSGDTTPALNSLFCADVPLSNYSLQFRCLPDACVC